MGTFRSIIDQINERRDWKRGGGPDGDLDSFDYELSRQDWEAVETFRRGLYTRGTRSPKKTFWYEFEQLARASGPGLAQMLGIDYAAVKKWPQIIEHYRNKVERLDAHQAGLRRPEMIPTGDHLPGLGQMTRTAPL